MIWVARGGVHVDMPRAKAIMTRLLRTGSLLLSVILMHAGCEDDSPPACEETSATLDIDEEGLRVPFSFETRLSELFPHQQLVTWTEGAPTSLVGTMTRVTVEVKPADDEVVEIQATNNAVEGDGAFLCSDHLKGNVTVRLSSDDGQLDESFPGTLSLWPDGERPGPVQLDTEELSPAKLEGTLKFAETPSSLGFSFGRWQTDELLLDLVAIFKAKVDSSSTPTMGGKVVELWQQP